VTTSILGRLAELAGFGANAVRVAAWLQRFGYWEAAAERMPEAMRSLDWKAIFERAVDLVRRQHGREIADLVDRPRCGCSDIEMLRGRGGVGLAQWPRGHVVRVHLADLPRGSLTPSDWADVFRDALTNWSSVCGFKWELVTAKPSDGLSVFSDREDGPNKTLAWCELPVAGVRLYRMKLDESETWVRSGRGIVAEAVVTHELGHGIGINHIPESKGAALMNPFYDEATIKPKPLDVAEAVARYGLPNGGSPPPPPTDHAISVTALYGGRTYRGELKAA
jgi:hypothetical protein